MCLDIGTDANGVDLVCIRLTEHLADRPNEDQDIEAQITVRNVLAVEVDAPLDGLNRRYSAAKAMDLRPSRDAGFHPASQRVAVDDLAELDIVLKRVRAGSNERHLAANDIKQLRKFIEARLPETASHLRDARIAAGCLRDRSVILGDCHRAELVHPKRTTVDPSSGLSEQDRAGRFDAYRNRNSEEHRQRKDKYRYRDDEVERAFA
jgi:hypothetical protein